MACNKIRTVPMEEKSRCTSASILTLDCLACERSSHLRIRTYQDSFVAWKENILVYCSNSAVHCKITVGLVIAILDLHLFIPKFMHGCF
jgi:hypothetical protein